MIAKDFEIESKYLDIRKWYNGYKIGNNNEIYNPWSILNFALSSKEGFKPYWVNTSSDGLLRSIMSGRNAGKLRDGIEILLKGNCIEKKLEESFIFNDLENDIELFWSLLFFSGYLTTESKLKLDFYNLKIPNFEIKIVFEKMIQSWLSTELKVHQNLLYQTTKYLISNEIERFEEGFKEIMGDTFSYFDTQNKPEYVYQAYVLGLLAVLGDDYIIKSNRESGAGRYDIMLIPYDKENYGIVIEIKQLPMVNNETEDDLRVRVTNKIKEAKQQIEDNKYYKELVANRIEKIIKLPIVFLGKEPYIVIPKS